MNKHLTLFATSPPVVLTWDDEAQAPHKPLLTNPNLANGHRFVCAQCGADVTRSTQRIAVAGTHRHTVPGPLGLDQEIGCFSLAPGCSVIGHFALDFSKPTTGQWRMGVCSTCGNHLGWHHQTEDGIGFFGLILDHLEVAPEESEEEPA